MSLTRNVFLSACQYLQILFVELSEEAEMAVEEAWQGKPGNILSEAFRMRIKGADLRTLSSLEWLNDEVRERFHSCITSQLCRINTLFSEVLISPLQLRVVSS